jgi:hypothetical protein
MKPSEWMFQEPESLAGVSKGSGGAPSGGFRITFERSQRRQKMVGWWPWEVDDSNPRLQKTSMFSCCLPTINPI